MVATYFLIFISSFAFIFTKAFQQRNVAFDHYWAIIPTSLLMALTEVYIVAKIATSGYSLTLVLVVGLGSGMGALLAALSHKRIFNKCQ